MSYSIKAPYQNLTLNSFAVGVIDIDLTSVSGADDTIPSAKATKTALDLKVNLAGTAGGQAIYGGTAAANNLTLHSTSNGIKGNIILGTSYYDEVNNRLGIRTAVPTASIHLPASTIAANSAPIKIETGVLMTTPEDGAIEFDGTHLYITISGSRTQIV